MLVSNYRMLFYGTVVIIFVYMHYIVWFMQWPALTNYYLMLGIIKTDNKYWTSVQKKVFY